jgi:small subunit ribosomal protein S8
MDTVSQFLTRIRNAGVATSGFIRSFKVAKDSKQGVMRVYLRYDEEGAHAITNVQRVSRPGRRVYVKSTDIPEIRSGLGTTIISTSQGLMSGTEAKTKNLGGELICKVW